MLSDIQSAAELNERNFTNRHFMGNLEVAIVVPILFGGWSIPFATPYEILPEWFLFPTFQILRVVPNKQLMKLTYN